jgi:glucans biosynthesis protein C
VLVVPPQPYFEVQRVGFTGSYLEFLKLYFSGYGGFCGPGGGCLILPTWNHLWFLAYLISYTVMLALALRRWPQLPQRLARWLEPVLARPLWLLIAPVVYLVLTRWLLRDRFPSTHALVDDFYQHSQYLMMFLWGLALAHSRAAWQGFEALRWLALGLALAAWFTLVWLSPGHGLLGMLVMSLQQWCAIVAAGGFAHRHLNHDSAWRRYFTEAILPLYVLHQTVIIVAAMALRRFALAPALEGPLLVLLAFGVSWGVYEAVRRVNLLRPAFGLRRLTPRLSGSA